MYLLDVFYYITIATNSVQFDIRENSQGWANFWKCDLDYQFGFCNLFAGILSSQRRATTVAANHNDICELFPKLLKLIVVLLIPLPKWQL